MKRRITLSIALVLSVVLVSLMSSDSTAKAQQPQRFRFPTGVITSGEGQTLSIRVDTGNLNADDTLKVRFVRTQYMAAGCSGMLTVCRLTVASRSATPVTTLNGGEALSYDVGLGNGDGAFKIEVETDNRNAQVNAMIVNANGQVASIIGILIAN